MEGSCIISKSAIYVVSYMNQLDRRRKSNRKVTTNTTKESLFPTLPILVEIGSYHTPASTSRVISSTSFLRAALHTSVNVMLLDDMMGRV